MTHKGLRLVHNTVMVRDHLLLKTGPLYNAIPGV